MKSYNLNVHLLLSIIFQDIYFNGENKFKEYHLTIFIFRIQYFSVCPSHHPPSSTFLVI